MATVEGDKQFNTTIEDFFTKWLLTNNSPQATKFFAPSSYACMPPERASPGSKALIGVLSEVRNKVGARHSLQDYLQPVVPDDPELKRVVQANDNAYVIVSMPGTEAQSFSCNKTKKLPADASYYGSIFRFRTTDGNDSATLYVIWGKQNGAWKVVAWRVISVG